MPTLSSYSFRSLPICLQPCSKSLQLDHIANLDDRLFEITAPTESLSAGHGRHQSNHHPRTEVKDSDQVGSHLFYVNGKFLLFLHWTIAAYSLRWTWQRALTFSTLT